MPTSAEGFSRRLAELKSELIQQGSRVQALLEEAFEAFFSADRARAQQVIQDDDQIDRVDVDLERASVRLLGDATKDGAALAPEQLRAVLTIVKVNNELERIADAAVAIAERVATLADTRARLPVTLRVMANSVVGILRDVIRALDRMDAQLAKVALQSEDTVEAFKAAILREAEEMIAASTMSVDAAFVVHEFATQCERMADHCTNIAEQVIYSVTGEIIRHTGGVWQTVPSASAPGRNSNG